MTGETEVRKYQVTSTAGPRIRLFHSMLLHYNANEELNSRLYQLAYGNIGSITYNFVSLKGVEPIDNVKVHNQ